VPRHRADREPAAARTAIIPCSVAVISLTCSRGLVPPGHSLSLMSAWISEASCLRAWAFGDLRCGCDGGPVGGQGACLITPRQVRGPARTWAPTAAMSVRRTRWGAAICGGPSHDSALMRALTTQSH
jgi:hypothetical protein